MNAWQNARTISHQGPSRGILPRFSAFANGIRFADRLGMIRRFGMPKDNKNRKNLPAKTKKTQSGNSSTDKTASKDRDQENK
jgi:hypothetical protein